MTNGDRFNGGKLRWRNFPMFLVRPLIFVAQFGEQKYDTFNYFKGLPANDLMDCIKRHLDSFEDPSQSDIDEESSQSHLAHVAWNALVLLWVLAVRPELDDRWKGVAPEENELSEENLYAYQINCEWQDCSDPDQQGLCEYVFETETQANKFMFDHRGSFKGQPMLIKL